jgi:Predicted membrane-bound metal-dependent hydrolase (DUF457).
MSALGHVAVGVVTARLVTSNVEPAPVLRYRMLGLTTLALLPDIDLLVPLVETHLGPFGHRGATHSLLFAALVGVAVALVIAARRGKGPSSVELLAAGVVASHGIMDVFGVTNLGVELMWPISDARMLAPWHVLPNPTWEGLFSAAGLADLALEWALFVPLWLFAFWPRQTSAAR